MNAHQRILTALPSRFKAAFVRLLRNRFPRSYRDLYDNASLRHAPGVRMHLIPGDLISDSICMTGTYDEELTAAIVGNSLLRGLFVDVGANMGYFSLLWAAVAPENRSIAFEASPRNIDLLTQNIARNDFGERIKVIPKAAGRANEVLSFAVGPMEQTGWGGISIDADAETIAVEAVRLDDFVQVPIRFLKVDVEGADPWVLAGSERLLRSRMIEEIWFEENKERAALLGIEVHAGPRYLESMGYTCVPLNDPRSGMVNWRAVPATA